MLLIKVITTALCVLLICDQNSAKIRLCGKSLSEFMNMVCVDGFNPKNLKAKKSLSTFNNGVNEMETDFVPLPYSSFLMNKLYVNPNNLIATTRRRRHNGIIEECCRDGCTYAEFQSYCL